MLSYDKLRTVPPKIFFFTIVVLTLLLPWTKKFDKALLILGGVWLLWRLAIGFEPLGLEKLKAPLIAFFGWLALSTLTAVNPTLSFEGLLQWTANLLGFLVFIDIIRTPRQLGALAVAFLIGNAYLGGYCLVEYLGGAGRIGGPRQTWPTVLGRYLNFGLPWTLALVISWKNANVRFLAGIVALLLAFALAATLTRSAVIGALVSLFLLMGGFQKNRAFRWAALAILLLGIFYFPLLFERFLAISPEDSIGQATFSRPIFWERSLALLSSGLRPLTGVGMRGSFQAAFQQQPLAVIDPRYGSLNHAHSFIIQYLAAWGLPGFVAYLWFLGSYFRQLLRSRYGSQPRLSRILQGTTVAVLTGFWTAELFDVAVSFRTNMTCYWWTLALGLVGVRLNKVEEDITVS